MLKIDTENSQTAYTFASCLKITLKTISNIMLINELYFVKQSKFKLCKTSILYIQNNNSFEGRDRHYY